MHNLCVGSFFWGCEMLYYVYEITNTTNNKKYVGVHRSKTTDNDYMGSGKYLKRAIEKYGIQNFEKKILKEFDNPESAYQLEKEIVDENFVASKETYNIKLGGQGGFDYINENKLNIYEGIGKENTGLQNLKTGAECIEAMKRNGTYEGWIKNISDKAKGHKRWLGKKHKEESKKLIGEKTSIAQKGKGNSQYGTMWIYNQETYENKKIKKTDSIPQGWVKGRKI